MTTRLQAAICRYAMCFRLALTNCLLTAASISFCQETVFFPAPPDQGFLDQLYKRFEEQHLQQLSSLPRANREDYKKIYESRWEYIKGRFDKKEIYTDKTAQRYLDAITGEIVRGNPVLAQKTFRCFFSRSAVPNASYLGHGLILFNMGLFHRLQSESQAAFVIAHEIAHFVLNHSENAINKYVAYVNSKEVQDELRKIKGSQYGRREQYDRLVKDLTFSSRRHSRDHETQADSLAIALLGNTRFDLGGALETLALLDTVDQDNFKVADALQQQFNAPAYPFQQKWITKDDGLLGGHAALAVDSIMADSLKTHPDCQLRIRQLRPLIEKEAVAGRQGNAIDAIQFVKWQQQFRYETVAYAFANNNYTWSLYLTLSLLQQKPGDHYLITHTGQLFNGMYDAQKTHTLGKFVDLPAPGNSAGYNLLLQFVQNLHREQYAAIGYHLLTRYREQLGQFAPFKEVYSKSVQIMKE